MSLWDRPDWVKYATGVQSRAQDSTGKHHTALGDPLRWGGKASQIIQAQAVYPPVGPLVRIQVADTYSRLWPLMGTVTAASSLWAVPANTWQCILIVTSGAGQAVTTQHIDLRLLTTAALASFAPILLPGVINPEPYESRAFGPVNILLGQTVSFQMRNALPLAGHATPVLVETVALVAPLAAGTGL